VALFFAEFSLSGLGLATANYWAITQTLSGREAAGRWTGIQNGLGNLAGVTAPTITGVIVARTTDTVQQVLTAQGALGFTGRHLGDLVTGSVLFRETMAPNLRVQREAAGLDDVQLDRVIEGSVDRGNGSVYAPGACAIVGTVFEESRRMLQPLLVAGAARSDLRTRTEIYQRRLDDLFAHAPVCADDLLTKKTISALTKLWENVHDTMHQLVIDLHW
jgi:hypothetical protein